MFKVITKVRASERVAEQIADVSFPHITEEVEAAKFIPQERSQQCIEEVVDILATQLPEHVVGTVEILQVRMPERIAEKLVDVPVPQIQEEIVEVTQIIPQECILERMVVSVPVSQISEQTVEAGECLSERIIEQIFSGTNVSDFGRDR